MKPLAIDLFCGLGGWAEGFLAEGYTWYDWICHTKQLHSLKDSLNTLIKRLLAGCGLVVNRLLATASSLSKREPLRRWRTAFLSLFSWEKFQTVYRFCINATYRRACAQTICSSELNPTICRTRSPREDGSTHPAINLARTILTRFFLTNGCLRCWLNFPLEVGQ